MPTQLGGSEAGVLPWVQTCVGIAGHLHHPTKAEGLWLRSLVPRGPQRGRAAGLLPVREEPASTHRWDVELELPHAHPYVRGINSAETDWYK